MSGILTLQSESLKHFAIALEMVYLNYILFSLVPNLHLMNGFRIRLFRMLQLKMLLSMDSANVFALTRNACAPDYSLYQHNFLRNSAASHANLVTQIILQ
ncbi:hypothetical protein HN873_005361 [Arachis hypogaea]